MKTYQVTIARTAYVTYTVEADNQESAEAQAWEQYSPDDADDCASNDIYAVEELAPGQPLRVSVTGFWNDTKEHFDSLCIVGESTSEDDDDVMYYFDSVGEIIGNHGDFTITSYHTEI